MIAPASCLKSVQPQYGGNPGGIHRTYWVKEADMRTQEAQGSESSQNRVPQKENQKDRKVKKHEK